MAATRRRLLAAASRRCLALILAPFSFGLVLAVLLSMFGRDFTGERRAREVTTSLRPA